MDSKAPLVLLDLASMIFVFFLPVWGPALLLSALVSGVSILAWHSWLGAYQPLVPWCFLFLFLFRAAAGPVRRRLLLDSLLLALLAGILHSSNGMFLGGYEFRGEGTLYKDFPEVVRTWLLDPQAPAVAARVWLGLWAIAAALLALGRRAGWVLLAVTDALTISIYKVTFYALFLFTAAAILFDEDYLRTWRGRFTFSGISPIAVFIGGEALFFVWYLFFRQCVPLFLIVAALCAAAMFGAEFRPGEPCGPRISRGPRGVAWIAVWTLYLLAPIFLPQLPPPFGETQFSAREAFVRPRREVINPFELSRCSSVRNMLALRWGYRLSSDGEFCTLFVYF